MIELSSPARSFSSILSSNSLYISRLISHVAHGIGIPISYIPLGETKSVLGSERSAVATLAEAALSLQAGLDGDGDRLSTDDHRFEHPFMSLVRESPLWLAWEHLWLQGLAPDIPVDEGPVKRQYPIIFAKSLQLYAESVSGLPGLLIYGPLPAQEAFESAQLATETNAFLSIMDKWNEDHSGAPGSENMVNRGASYRSPDRLRRMFHARGQTIDAGTRSSVTRASDTIRQAMAARIEPDLIDAPLSGAAFALIEEIASAAATVNQFAGRSQSTFYSPRLDALDIEIRQGTTGSLVLHKSVNRARIFKLVSHGQRSLPVVLNVDGVDGDQTNFIRDFQAQADDRHSQGILYRFMLMRHWLNDRFARLNSLYYDRPDSEAQDNLRDMCGWLLRLFDADFAAIYNVAPGGALKEVVRASTGTDESAEASRLNSEYMENLARPDQASRRTEAVCYRAFADSATDSVADWNGVSDGRGMAGEFSDLIRLPRSALGAPIIVFGKSWGVIELIGFLPNQFDRVAAMWLEEASQLVGDALFQTWILKQTTQANLAVLAESSPELGLAASVVENVAPECVDAQHIEDALLDKDVSAFKTRNRICREMAELFIADGAALWLNNDQWPGRFQLRGCYGVEFPPLLDIDGGRPLNRADWPEIFIDDRSSLVAAAMREIGTSFTRMLAKNLDPPDPGSEAHVKYQAALLATGLRRLTVIPLRESVTPNESKPIGALCLYSRENQSGAPYGERWMPIMEFAGRHLAMLVRTLALEADRQNSLELMFSHEVIGSLRQVDDQYGYLERNLLEPYFAKRGGQGGATVHTAQINDLELAAKRIKGSIVEAVSRLEEMRRDGFAIRPNKFDFRSRAPWDGEPSVLFNLIQSAFNSRYLDQQRRNVNWRVTGSKEFIRINRHPADVERILSNLADNAMKYSTPGSEILVHIDLRPTGSLWITFMNNGPPLAPGESERIFNLGFRSASAYSGDMDGSGNGLFIARSLASSMGADLIYDHLDTNKGIPHRFALIFMPEAVTYGR